MPRLLNKKYIKAKFKYTWYVFLIAALLLPLLWIWSFTVLHQPLPFQKIHTFFAAGLEDANIGIKLQKKLGEDKLRAYEFIAEQPGSISFETKFTNIGLNTSDILILNKEVADRVVMSNFFVTLDESLLKTYFKSSTDLYKDTRDNKNYGVKLNQNSTWTKSHINYKSDESYYIFLNKVSHGIGKYNESEEANHTLAFEVASLYQEETI